MNMHSPGSKAAHLAGLPHFAAARRLASLLARALLLDLAAIAALLAALLWPTPLQRWAGAAAAQGVAGPVLGTLLLAATGLAACLVLAAARRRSAASSMSTPTSRLGGWLRRRLPGPRLLEPVSWAATWPQACVLLIGTAAAAWCLWRFWPHQAAPALPPRDWFVLAAGLVVLSFPYLVCERLMGDVPAESLPEAAPLRALLVLPVAFLLAEAALSVAAGLALPGLYWAQLALAVAVAAVTTELALRALALWFLPPPDAAGARAAIGSVLAPLVRRRSLSPAALAETIRDQLGLDFSRSWAIAYVRAAAAPVCLLMLLFCWGLSGVTRVDLRERGIYERFGAPVAVLAPGLHLILPWPFGTIRRVGYGVVHAVSVGIGEADTGTPPPPPDLSTAEGPAPDSANRLWDQAQPSDVAYIIASEIGGRQSFGTVDVDLQVLFRIGLDDRAALAASYRIVDPDTLVRQLSGTLLAHYFASQTLSGVLEENTRTIASQLQAQLQAELDAMGSGIEVVATTIAAIHPPSGAAEAYRSVQAAEIAATTEISNQRGLAATTASIARRDARAALDQAQASGAETLAGARVRRTEFGADEQSYHASGEGFLLERYLGNLRQALPGAQLEILDSRLNAPGQSVLDLRPQTAPPTEGLGEEGKSP